MRKKFIAGVVMAGFAFGANVAFAQNMTEEDLQEWMADLTQQVAGLQEKLGEVSDGGMFSQDLSLGSKGPDVLKLQRILNQGPDTQVAQTGAGSEGSETLYYGSRTADAVARFQEKYLPNVFFSASGASLATGFFGPATRAKLNSFTSGPWLQPVSIDSNNEEE